MEYTEKEIGEALLLTYYWQTETFVLDYTREQIREFFPKVKDYFGKDWNEEEGWMYGDFDEEKCIVEITDLNGAVITRIDLSSVLNEWIAKERGNVIEDSTVLGSPCLYYKDEVIEGGDGI